MKKTLTINLAGIVYHIDEDAFARLQSYLNNLEKELKSEEGYKDIIADIESRIAELLNERLSNSRQVVTMTDINEIVEILGDPEIISGMEDESSKSRKKKYSNKRNYRRMYRDPDARVIGGVASGLAAYWRVDPSIVRIIFVLLTIFGLAGILIYLILWIILPEAQTTAQKLEMRGEPVNIENIKQFFKDEFENVKKNFKK